MKFLDTRSAGLGIATMALLGCQPSSDSTPAAGRPAPKEIRGQAIQPLSARATTNVSSSATSAIAVKANGAVVAVPPVAPVAEKTGDYLNVGFDKLASFTYEVADPPPAAAGTVTAPPPKTADQIPATVRALDQKRVALKGFMLPLKVEGGLITELLIMRDQSMCCYGAVPKITEWVSVKMTGKGVKPVMDQPITLFGKLRVGEIRENGYLVGIYQMDGEKMGGPLEL